LIVKCNRSLPQNIRIFFTHLHTFIVPINLLLHVVHHIETAYRCQFISQIKEQKAQEAFGFSPRTARFFCCGICLLLLFLCNLLPFFGLLGLQYSQLLFMVPLLLQEENTQCYRNE